MFSWDACNKRSRKDPHPDSGHHDLPVLHHDAAKVLFKGDYLPSFDGLSHRKHVNGKVRGIQDVSQGDSVAKVLRSNPIDSYLQEVTQKG
jgi:hypothetical protein